MTDFGISTTKDVTSSLVGTPFAIPPEMIAREAYDSSKIDIWALGVLAFQILLGHSPFDSSNLSSMREKQMQNDWLKGFHRFGGGDLSPNYKCFLSATLDPEPINRPSIN